MSNVWARPVGINEQGAQDYWEYFGTRLVERAEIFPGAIVLDIACGDGSSLLPAAQRTGYFGRAIGIDICPRCVPAARSRVEQKYLSNAEALFMNARNIGFAAGTFDIALCGFMGWYDCFDFAQNKFTQADTKTPEIHRVLRDGGKFVCCSWEMQEDLAWMEKSMLRHYPELLQDAEYLEQRPIGMAYEKTEGYNIILRAAGFVDIDFMSETAEFISTDEEEWWQQMQSVGWQTLFDKIKSTDPNLGQKIKESIFVDLQRFKQPDGIHFSKSVFFFSAVK
jgi:ubiquinone/menaquinone biosynthesis C-methylase UbiE